MARYEGKGYAELKSEVVDVLIAELSPVQEKVKSLLADKASLEEIYRKGAEKANYVSNKMLRKMQKKVGFIPR